ncbi:hypothetical protein GN244_ATG19204 [Phytophthora infestans]|uniref:Uncharacterized protein n=1 Tax=Phytophthora infestans TaxID=4787 RepID=A0A833S578_PHYIN|nr:hypothetical protein GN244_ATG19204 [Phytophthora infestans]
MAISSTDNETPRMPYRFLGNSAQLKQNLKAPEVLPLLTPNVKAKIDAALPFVPHGPEKDWASMIRQRHL